MVHPIFTIGHSSHSITDFLNLLKRHSIEAIADIRSNPYSARHPHFNSRELKRSLKREAIDYVFLGKELGGRSLDPEHYRNDVVQYHLLTRSEEFERGIERVREGMQRMRVALMCAEREPLVCHRTILVAKSLEETGIAVSHILSDGEVERHSAAMSRLLSQLGLGDSDLFTQNPKENWKAAYRLQAQKIAYRRPRQTHGTI